VTESVFNEGDIDRVLATLLALRQRAPRCMWTTSAPASSLSRLREFPHRGEGGQELRAGGDERSLAVIEGTVLIARRFGLRVIAEGVETAEQAAALAAWAWTSCRATTSAARAARACGSAEALPPRPEPRRPQAHSARCGRAPGLPANAAATARSTWGLAGQPLGLGGRGWAAGAGLSMFVTGPAPSPTACLARRICRRTALAGDVGVVAVGAGLAALALQKAGGARSARWCDCRALGRVVRGPSGSGQPATAADAWTNGRQPVGGCRCGRAGARRPQPVISGSTSAASWSSDSCQPR
jgi:hypothetical protein